MNYVVSAIFVLGLVLGLSLLIKFAVLVVHKDLQGNVCSCIVDKVPATKEQCNKIGKDSVYEIVYVRRCN